MTKSLHVSLKSVRLDKSDLLLYRLLMNGIDVTFDFTIKTIYCQIYSCIK